MCSIPFSDQFNVIHTNEPNLSRRARVCVSRIVTRDGDTSASRSIGYHTKILTLPASVFCS